MLSFRILAILIAIGFLGGCAPIKSVAAADEDLYKTVYNNDIAPSCIMDFSPIYREHVCFQPSHRTYKDSVEELHLNFLKALKYQEGLPTSDSERLDDPYEKYDRATCTVGIRLSCSLAEILIEKKADFDVDWIMWLISGYAVTIDPDMSKLYPENYDPRDPDQFKDVLLHGIDYLNAEHGRSRNKKD